VKEYSFPKNDAFLDQPDRAYDTLGAVKTRVDFVTLNPDWDESRLCRNYYNKAVRDLVSRAKDQGGDAVIGVRSVVFMVDGSHHTYRTPECADDGQSGQILTEAIAIRWKRPGEKAVRPKQAPLREEAPREPAPSEERAPPGPVSPVDPLF
jgi:hypothetical protein